MVNIRSASDLREDLYKKLLAAEAESISRIKKSSHSTVMEQLRKKYINKKHH